MGTTSRPVLPDCSNRWHKTYSKQTTRTCTFGLIPKNPSMSPILLDCADRVRNKKN